MSNKRGAIQPITSAPEAPADPLVFSPRDLVDPQKAPPWPTADGVGGYNAPEYKRAAARHDAYQKQKAALEDQITLAKFLARLRAPLTAGLSWGENGSAPSIRAVLFQGASGFHPDHPVLKAWREELHKEIHDGIRVHVRDAEGEETDELDLQASLRRAEEVGRVLGLLAADAAARGGL